MLKSLYNFCSTIPILELLVNKYIYRWNHDYLNPLAMADGLPFPCFPKFEWLSGVIDKAGTIIENHVEIETAEKVSAIDSKISKIRVEIDREDINILDLFDLADDIKRIGELSDDQGKRPRDLDDYANLFQSIEIPAIAAGYSCDTSFAAMRTAGPNPVMLCRKTELPDNFPVKEEEYSTVMPDDSLESALKEGRIYICDYQLLELLVKSTDGPEKFLYAPIALFAVDKISEELIPVAIQCQQTPGPDNRVYVADDSNDWLIAKSIVAMADANYHEAVTHLGMTHLLIEPFIVATARNLPSKHPVHKLLWPHFEGNIFINYAAIKTLINPGGIVELLLNGKLDSILKMTVQGLFTHPFNESFLPDTFIRRDVMDLKYYPYRDDALMYWNAIKNWVRAYLNSSYNKDVSTDRYIQNWTRDLLSESGGRVKGFGQNGGVNNNGYLIDVLTMIIYTSSVQHAAVNFPQYDMMSYCPNMPLAAYSSFPGNSSQKTGRHEYLDMLPCMDLAELQQVVTYLLGSVHYTRLGQYDAGHFGPDVVNGPLRKFQMELNDIGEKIEITNQERRPYTTLLPGLIPQSINI